MGAMSLNLTEINEQWIRKSSNMSARVNHAINQFRHDQQTEWKDIDQYSSRALVRLVFSRCQGNMTEENPLGALNETQYLRLTNAMNTLLLCVDEMNSHEVVE